ncbi:unnamed protein product [Rhodiola kirilowii]
MNKVSVVYYLSRNGHLEHPHFMEVPLSCPDGLYLKDVISRLNLLRGTAMASLYSWSSKRSYKHGFVWHDLCEEDYIHPVHGLEYVLKGSEILDEQAMIQSSVKKSPEDWSSSVAADASTRTDDKKLCGRLVAENEQCDNQIVELDGSPPPMDSNSSSSPETLEALMKSDKRLTSVSTNTSDQDASQSGRLKASSVLMQLITCGSFSFRDCGATAVKDHGMRLISEYREDDQVKRKMEGLVENQSSFERVSLEDKEYFSGSVIENQRKEEFLTLNRSSSYNADRVSTTLLELAEKKSINKNTKEEPNGVVRRSDAANFNSQRHGTGRKS